MKWYYSNVLMNERLGEKLSTVYDGNRNDHPERVTAKSFEEFQTLMDDFLRSMGIPEKGSMADRMNQLRQKNRTYKDSVTLPYARTLLRVLGRNACFRLHFEFVSEPLSSSDTEKKEEILRGVEKPGVKSAMKELCADLFPESVKGVGDYLQCTAFFTTESEDSMDVDGAVAAGGAGVHTQDSTDGETAKMEVDPDAIDAVEETTCGEENKSMVAVGHKVSEESLEESSLLRSYSADQEDTNSL